MEPDVRITINEKLRAEIAEEITDMINQAKFGAKSKSGSTRCFKIEQNTQLMTLKLLGLRLTLEEIRLFKIGYTKPYLTAGISVGEAVGQISAQSLVQPVTQAALKSQHKAGQKDASDETLLNLNALNVSNRIFKVHFKTSIAPQVLTPVSSTSPVPSLSQQELSKMYEEVILGDVLASTYGDAKYVPMKVEENYTENTRYVFLPLTKEEVVSTSKTSMPTCIVHRFQMDAQKLLDAGLTQLNVYELLAKQVDLGFVLHTDGFSFDTYPLDGNRNTAFNKKVKALLSEKLKGITGLNMIGERKAKVSDLAPYMYYDLTEDTTTIYFNMNMASQFPIEEFLKRVKQDKQDTKQSQQVEQVEQAQIIKPIASTYRIQEMRGKPAYVSYKGKVVISQTPHTYFHFIGSLSIDTLIEHPVLGKLINMNYLISNDAYEMIKFVGLTGARIAHEFAYSEELNKAGTPLLYQNITSLCRRIFEYRITPITPSGYMKASGVTPLERLGFQNYRNVLEMEIIKGNEGSTNNLPAAIIVGRKPSIGTAAMKTEIIEARRKEVIELYSQARQEQRYFGKYKGISFPPFGTIKPMTVLNMDDTNHLSVSTITGI